MIKWLEKLTRKFDSRKFTGCPYCIKATDVIREPYFYCSYQLSSGQIARLDGNEEILANRYWPCRYLGNLLHLPFNIRSECKLQKPSVRR